jgi:hypothetical protein
VLIPGLVLSSCSDASGFKALERVATPDDALPDGANFGPETKLDKVLLVAEANGKKYFLGQDDQELRACLGTFPVNNPTGWHSGCVSAGTREGEILKTYGPDQEASILVTDGYDTKELEQSGWTKIHENILVSDG